MRDATQKVIAFHQKFNQPIAERPCIPLKEIVIFRETLMRDEYRELKAAIERDDIEHIAREGIDLIYTIIGTLKAYGIPVEASFNAVHEANMLKIPAKGDSKCNKPIKPPGWQEPNMKVIIEKAYQDYFMSQREHASK